MRTALSIPPGILADGTSHSSGGRWGDGSNVRFSDEGQAETIGGWESVVPSLMTGVCRSIFPWTDNAATLTLGLGTHSKLQLWQGGGLYDITPVSGFTAGQINGTGSTGYGTGGYGVGGYGSPSATDYFPLTWSMAAWGQKLLASPRNQTIFEWSNNTGTPAAALSNAPARVTYMLVAKTRQVFALGCNEESSGTFNPLCIRHSSVGNNNQWNTGTATTAREYVLPGGGRIVAGRLIGDRILVWTNDGLFMGTYVGSLTQPWRFDPVSKGAGLIGPNAVVVRGQTAYWITPDLQFMSYGLGGVPNTIPCPIREDFADNLAASQSDKIVASSIGKHSEIRFDYPDARDGIENSRYVAVKVSGPVAGTWYRGEMARTAMVDAGASAYPCGATFDGHLYWHERGHSADGGVLSWFIETSDQKLDENGSIMIAGMWSDFADQLGPVSVTLTSRFKPNGAAVVKGPYAVSPFDDKTDMRALGRYHRIKFAGASAPSFARIGEPVFDTRPGGQR